MLGESKLEAFGCYILSVPFQILPRRTKMKINPPKIKYSSPQMCFHTVRPSYCGLLGVEAQRRTGLLGLLLFWEVGCSVERRV